MSLRITDLLPQLSRALPQNNSVPPPPPQTDIDSDEIVRVDTCLKDGKPIDHSVHPHELHNTKQLLDRSFI